MSHSIFWPGWLGGSAIGLLGATAFYLHARLFLFEDLQLLWVIANAGAVGVIGVWILKFFRVRALLVNAPLPFEGKSMRRFLIPGSLMFGVGWGLTGSCPGTAPVMLGEGKLAAFFTISGIVLGTYLYGMFADKQGRRSCVPQSTRLAR